MTELSPQLVMPDKPHPILSRWAALACATTGVGAVVVLLLHSLLAHGTFVLLPSLYVTVPVCVVAAGFAIASLVKRERSFRLVAAGMLAALSSIFLGWVVIATIVVLVGWLAAHALGELL